MTPPDAPSLPPDGAGRPRSPAARLFKVEPGEAEPLLLACGYFFCLLAAYYLLRPLRDAMGTAWIEDLKWLYVGTALAMLPATMLFSALTVRLGRGRFIPIAYRFFLVTFLAFFAALKLLPADMHIVLGPAFFIWLSVFNLFVVSVFWSFMADLFTNRQGRRLFGVIAVGGTLGHTCGSFVAGRLAETTGSTILLLAGAALLEVACWFVHRLNALTRRRELGTGSEIVAEAAIGGRAWDGLLDIARSRYLRGIALFMVFYAVTSTLLYFTKQHVAEAISTSRDDRVAFFASIDFWTGVVTIVGQVFLTSRVIARAGIGVTLGVLPVITMLGFAALAVSLRGAALLPVATVIVIFEPLRRAGNFIFARPAREVLYTVVSRDEKYKAKNFIDTFVYRSSDVAGAWIYFGALATSIACVPLAAVWLVLALSLGRRQRDLAARP